MLLTYSFGTARFNGLSLPLLADATAGAVGQTDFAAKLLLTVVTLSFGFKGGEVTPLFVIGATAANAVAQWLGVPVAGCAMLGFVSLFAAASGAPIACAIMAGELFGWSIVPWAAATGLIAAVMGPAESLYGIRRPWIGPRNYFKTGKWSKD
jgi:H+/Cl- antiporter ClcA